MLDVSVVLPTYNEAQNIPVMVGEIFNVLKTTGIEGEVIVVDDNSPDKTGQIAQELTLKYPVRVLVRKDNRGLASAVLEGFYMSTAKVCVVMDADGSHPVNQLPEMIRPIIDGKADSTVATRYIDSAGISNWPWHRQLISRFAGYLAIGVTNLSDPTSGYMGIDRCILEEHDFNPIGWKIVLEIIVKASPLRVKEIPIVFKDRQLGESKMSYGEIINYIKHLISLYIYKLGSVLKGRNYT